MTSWAASGSSSPTVATSCPRSVIEPEGNRRVLHSEARTSTIPFPSGPPDALSRAPTAAKARTGSSRLPYTARFTRRWTQTRSGLNATTTSSVASIDEPSAAWFRTTWSSTVTTTRYVPITPTVSTR